MIHMTILGSSIRSQIDKINHTKLEAEQEERHLNDKCTKNESRVFFVCVAVLYVFWFFVCSIRVFLLCGRRTKFGDVSCEIRKMSHAIVSRIPCTCYRSCVGHSPAWIPCFFFYCLSTADSCSIAHYFEPLRQKLLA